MANESKYGLSESDIYSIISLLARNARIMEVVLFGSRAKGNYSVGSDIDLAIKGHGLELNDLTNAMIEIEELYLPYRFDLIIYNNIKEIALIEHIDRCGISLYKRV